ncbi:DegT/DnrJ/EryC1/StrS family aminotransferase [uncultured Roseobacter sp.]|uniref:DegT/DnrJ/EryC1/StrS family aminotransferase n=1 Tax=uncultured Roseobacter sp. TaxID=114847 RepID=UPI0026177976|nr:DegT/DnrJ/EryC1/StrS family aminotransferase [uncultured Roseobacter sp.]
MVHLLRCPRVSLPNITKYLETADAAQTYSNFGPCSRLLQKRLAEQLSVPVESTCLGSNATALLSAACEVVSSENGPRCRGFFPVFSFFATFSVAKMLDRECLWYDLDEALLPVIDDCPAPQDLVYLTATFGTSSLERLFDFAASVPCPVIIDAAACLPALLYNRQKLSNIPPNVIVVFSLHATKLLSAGEGGFCVFGNNIPDHIEKLTNFGIDTKRSQKWERSFNAKMSEFNAAVGLSSLDDFETNVQTIMQAKEQASSVAQGYGLNLYHDFRTPTLTLNLRVNDAAGLISEMVENGFELRQWWSLSPEADRTIHPNSFALHSGLLGLPFDWTCVNTYFEPMCEMLTSTPRARQMLSWSDC